MAIKYISQNQDKKWKVSTTKTGKAIKTFDTQKEAIAYSATIKDTESILIKRSTGWAPATSWDASVMNKAKSVEKNSKAQGTTVKKAKEAAVKKATTVAKEPIAPTKPTKPATPAKPKAPAKPAAKKPVAKKAPVKTVAPVVAKTVEPKKETPRKIMQKNDDTEVVHIPTQEIVIRQSKKTLIVGLSLFAVAVVAIVLLSIFLIK